VDDPHAEIKWLKWENAELRLPGRQDSPGVGPGTVRGAARGRDDALARGELRRLRDPRDARTDVPAWLGDRPGPDRPDHAGPGAAGVRRSKRVFTTRPDPAAWKPRDLLKRQFTEHARLSGPGTAGIHVTRVPGRSRERHGGRSARGRRRAGRPGHGRGRHRPRGASQRLPTRPRGSVPAGSEAKETAGSQVPAQAVYLGASHARSATAIVALTGARSYKIRFPAGDLPPHGADGFWSITLYNAAGCRPRRVRSASCCAYMPPPHRCSTVPGSRRRSRRSGDWTIAAWRGVQPVEQAMLASAG
jgi:Protein of unknown function (DUF1214)